MRGDRGAEGAVEAWSAIVLDLPRAILAVMAVVLAGAIPAEIYGTHV